MENKKAFTLIVDDEVDMCWALENILKKEGLCLKSAISGQEALQLIKLHHFQLAFLDAKLPDIDGLELARLIKIVNPTIPIMMISGYFYKDDVMVQKALSEGLIYGFISKPFLHSEIVKVLEKFNSF